MVVAALGKLRDATPARNSAPSPANLTSMLSTTHATTAPMAAPHALTPQHASPATTTSRYFQTISVDALLVQTYPTEATASPATSMSISMEIHAPHVAQTAPHAVIQPAPVMPALMLPSTSLMVPVSALATPSTWVATALNATPDPTSLRDSAYLVMRTDALNAPQATPAPSVMPQPSLPPIQ